MQINITPGEAQALVDLMDRECRTGGVQAAALYGPVARQIIEAAQAETQEQDNGENHGHD